MIVALTGLLISFFAYFIAFPNPARRRFDIYLALLSLHLLLTVAYWLYHFEAAMDAFTYYRDPFNFYSRSPFDSGTYFIVHIVQTMRSVFGGSFLDYFLFFQCFGMIAFALLIRSFGEIADSFGIQVPTLLTATLFLPGFHFWSVAIGKDAPMFMAIALACWASLRLQRRYVWLGIAVLIMFAIRPHVAAITLLATFAAFVMARNVPRIVRALMIPVAIGGMVFTLVVAGEQLGVDFGEAGAVREFVQYQQNLGGALGSGRDISSLPFPLKVFTLLFRPLFFDAPGVMGLVASFENVVLLLIFGWTLLQWRILMSLVFRVYHITFCAVFSSTLIVGLAMINYNLGLGQRQKMMVMPAVLLIFASVYLYRRYLAQQPQAALAQSSASSSVTAATA
jgi:hypothetical protein